MAISCLRFGVMIRLHPDLRYQPTNFRLTCHINMNEHNSEDGEDGQFAVSTDLVQLPNVKKAGYSMMDFDGILSKPLELREDLAKGCGGALWPAGMVLAKYILRRHSAAIQDKVMLELSTSFLTSH
jgi:predicted nicotinamide N-methyase